MEMRRGRRRPAGHERALSPLEEIHRKARRALACGDRGLARTEVEALGRCLETHFALEDRVYFPAVAALRPDLGVVLRRLRFEHDSMLAWVADLLVRLSSDSDEITEDELDALLATFERHEGEEEVLLLSLEESAGSS